MKTLRIFGPIALICLGAHAQQPTSCSSFNYPTGPFPTTALSKGQHTTGAHVFSASQGGSCTYTGQASTYGPVPCSVVSQAYSTTTPSEIGTLTPTGTKHVESSSDQGSTSTANGGLAAVSNAMGAMAIQSCYLVCGGSIGISFSSNGQGGGISVAFTGPTPLWTYTSPYTNTCSGYTLPQLPTSDCPNPTSNPPSGGGGDNEWVSNNQSCTWNEEPNNSPIVIDTTGKGFRFSDPTAGHYVTFDVRGNGKYERVSWPKPDSGNAWLVLDTGDGIIKDGKQLFGNFTPHSDGGVPNNHYANGFLALGWYTNPAQGGSGDRIIDNRSAIWPKLKLWIDKHCYLYPDSPCQSDPSELHTLESLGINSLSIVYTGAFKTDAVGNRFKYSAVLNPEAHDTPDTKNWCVGCDLTQRSKDGRLMYDVFLKTVQ